MNPASRNRRAEVVVVGAGVVGASVAYHLAARGCTDVVVLDRGAQPGAGSTGRATGGFRSQFGSAVNVRLSLLSRDKLRRFADELGVDPGYRPRGYLFLARSPAAMAALRAARRVQQAEGFHETVEVTPDQIRRLNPALRTDDLLGGTFGPDDGFLRPLEVLRGYAEGAARLGVRFRYGEPVQAFRRQGGRLAAAVTPAGEIAAGSFVNAAGAWAAGVGRLAGAEVPVTPLRRQVAITLPTDLLPEHMPMTIIADDGFHLRVRDGRILLLWPDEPANGDPWDTSVQDGWVNEVVRRAHERLPCLRAAQIDRERCWAGLYEMSPDRHALLGRAPEVENLFLANGSSGHGVMHAPALGHLLAEVVLDGRAGTLDVHALRPGRFAEAAPVTGSSLL
jgi:sarcosine oxidase, subunit beta